MTMLRPPAVAGRFYPGDPTELAQQVADFCVPQNDARPAIACLVPHAGYIYSGRVAGAVYARLQLPRRFVMLGPRHFPKGKAQAILSDGAWQTPLGPVQIDSELSLKIMRARPALAEDAIAHASEHALEVQLPFLQLLAKEFTFVPIALGPVQFPDLEALGIAMADAISKLPERPLLVASSDMNHYESDDVTRRKDALALERFLALDPQGLWDIVRRESITMCGIGPAVSTIVAARRLGATRATLVAYATSAETNGYRDRVVGYAGVILD